MKMNRERQKLSAIVAAIEAAGYNSYEQLTGYVQTGNAAYITRKGGARAAIRELDPKLVVGYLAENGQMRLV